MRDPYLSSPTAKKKQPSGSADLVAEEAKALARRLATGELINRPMASSWRVWVLARQQSFELRKQAIKTLKKSNIPYETRIIILREWTSRIRSIFDSDIPDLKIPYKELPLPPDRAKILRKLARAGHPKARTKYQQYHRAIAAKKRSDKLSSISQWRIG